MVDEKDYPGVGYDCTKDAEAFEKFNGWRRQVLIGETNDGNAGMGGEGVAGHAGLYSTAADLGLSPLLVKEIFDIIVTLRKSGITVLLVEQNAKMALSIADRAYVLETGKITMEGKASDLLHDEKVRKAYLGA